MKIDASYIGKKIAFGLNQAWTVIFVENDEFWARNDLGVHQTFQTRGKWELVEEPKPIQKPSERINSLFCANKHEAITWEVQKIQAITDYLNEVIPGLLEKK